MDQFQKKTKVQKCTRPKETEATIMDNYEQNDQIILQQFL